MTESPFPSRSVERRITSRIEELEQERDRLKELLKRAVDELESLHPAFRSMGTEFTVLPLLADIRKELGDG